MGWDDLSRDNFASAQRLRDANDPRFYRSSISRSYYAAYAAASFHICRPGQIFAHGRNNPPHGDVPDLIGNVKSIPAENKRKVKEFLRMLLEARTTADYRPGRTIKQDDMLVALKASYAVLRLLGI